MCVHIKSESSMKQWFSQGDAVSFGSLLLADFDARNTHDLCDTYTSMFKRRGSRKRATSLPVWDRGGSGGLQQCSGTEEGGAGLRDGTFGGRAGTGSR